MSGNQAMYAETQTAPSAQHDRPAVLDPITGETDGDAYSPPEGRVARWGRWTAQVLVVALVVMMGMEMMVRSAFGWSIQFSNELGGYALVAITFLSLASGQLRHAYHSVPFVENRLGPKGRARRRLPFDFLKIGRRA